MVSESSKVFVGHCDDAVLGTLGQASTKDTRFLVFSKIQCCKGIVLELVAVLDRSTHGPLTVLCSHLAISENFKANQGGHLGTEIRQSNEPLNQLDNHHFTSKTGNQVLYSTRGTKKELTTYAVHRDRQPTVWAINSMM